MKNPRYILVTHNNNGRNDTALHIVHEGTFDECKDMQFRMKVWSYAILKIADNSKDFFKQ